MQKYILSAFLAVNVVAAGEAQRLRGLADEAHHFIACGDTKKLCGSDPFLPAAPDEEHEVRCCSDTRISGYKRNGGCRFYVASELVPLSGGKKVCHNSATYSEAEAICEKNGGRLCTKDEILSRCTRNTGCDHDHDHLWTSTEVPTDTPAPTASPPPPPPLPEGTKVYLACGDASNHLCGRDVTTHVAELEEQHEVRCCSDSPISKWRKWSSCGVWGESDLIGVDGGKPTCHEFKTYEEAVAICYANDARLCTKSEVLAGCTVSSGCNMDEEMVWTSTIYDEAAVAAAAAAAAEPVCEGPSGYVWGDPHVVSFDGYKYDCQGQGEYVIVQSKCSGDPLRVHGRFVDGSTTGQSGQGTVTRSVAIKVSENVPIVYISVPDSPVDGNCPMLYAIGSQDDAVPANQIVDHFKDNYPGAAKLGFDGKSVILTYPESGTRLELAPKKSWKNGCVLRTNVCITPEKHGCADCIAGLIGTPNGIKSDDWTTLNGDVLPLPTEGDLLKQGYDYCRANWCVNDYQNSLYDPVSFDKYNKCSVNTFDTSALQARIDALPASVVAKCEETDDVDACKLDAAMELDGTETDSTQAGLEAAESILQDISDAEAVHGTTEAVADGGAGDWTGVSQSTTTSDADSGTNVESTGTSSVLDVQKCLGDGKILLTEDEEDQPLHGDTIEIVTEDSDDRQVTFTVSQLWKDGTDTISWIAPVTRNSNMEMYCNENNKITGVKFEHPEPYTATCNPSTGWADVVLYVHDGSFKTSAATNEHNCKGWGNDNGIATYHFQLSCNDGATCSSSTESTTIIESGKPVPPQNTLSTDAVCKTTTLSTVSESLSFTTTPPETTDPPTTAPETSDPPTSPPKRESAPIPIASSNGDPHFKTWKNEHFEYHGQCDMILVKDESFANGIGLEVQIRTKLVRFWSYIRSVSIRIGDDILEIEGSADKFPYPSEELLYWMNLEYQGELKMLGGFPVKSWRHGELRQHFVIDLRSKFPGQEIEVATYREFIRVDFKNGSEESFGNAVGLLGDFKTGKTLARDGVTALDDFYEYGSEWQVLPSEHMLFHDVGHPQFPQKCIEPEDPRGDRRRRLDESSISEADAEKACSTIKDPLDRKDCVYDILATQDLGMVGAY